MKEMSLEEMVAAAGGTLDAMNKQSMDLMIKLFKAQGRKMEEIYQIKDLPDEQREYIRARWFQI